MIKLSNFVHWLSTGQAKDDINFKIKYLGK